MFYITRSLTPHELFFDADTASVKVKMIDILTSALFESLISGPNELGSSFYGQWCF